MHSKYQYMTGFGNSFETEAIPNTLPQGQNSPQQCHHGLYAEQLSGSAFTMPQHANERSWLYRIRPSVQHVGDFKPEPQADIRTAPCREPHALPIGAQRWDACPLPQQATSFVEGIHTMTTAGDSDTHSGMATHIYACNQSMENDYFFNRDGELLIVPELNGIIIHTEFGIIEATPGDIIVIPRGVIFKVRLSTDSARGYICENYGARFVLPDRGPIGANCLANPRDFKYPVAAFEDKECPCRLLVKWGGDLWSCEINHSPLDVVGWHGNYAPYKYDLRTFSPVGAIAFDHPDPSIFTVLTSQSEIPGTGNIDFVIFPERWAVAENTFRPPWYHRNIMSEFMGLIYGAYDAKETGFTPGGMSLHNSMLPHGPDSDAYEKASQADLKPVKLTNTMAFMFESYLLQRITRYAAELPSRQANYTDCWQPLRKYFPNK
ncbi:MAG: homogentisate 1,2-dioxygenase [Proteobacteria bacterium]|nr:homogentisate 1,2-dioxygenase [Pseudomonadota bacterium]MCH9758007.1 homogentisate 1,2-dioxygenase [Pseudomonadota bacterium]